MKEVKGKVKEKSRLIKRKVWSDEGGERKVKDKVD